MDKEKSVRKKQMIEKISEITITKTEEVALEKVFTQLANKKKYFDVKDVTRVLNQLGLILSKQQMELMIWEVDMKLNEQIYYNDLLLLYKKCIKDESGLEPKSLFYMIQFLMYCPKDKFTVTVENCLELIYVRLDKNKDLQTEIEYIFGKGYDNIQDKEIEIDFKTYLDKVFKKGQDERKNRERNLIEKFMNSPEVLERKNENS